ncbi:patatin family protein [Streptococcus sp. 121]|uniref:patatin-like phospholipase family protein n=1 Tax=Streptococcus sp. 121 TaxID=2797637 RepID=UPI0018F073FC|nr:patatin family protein [Streptococcus sp. 121]MBJ6746478.1 patatin family protein [Streptococcus sp. 121]
MKVGLVLEGGGMRGLYTAGVLDAFLDAGIKVDGLVSVSAGALFGVNFLSGQRGRALRYNKRFIRDKNYISLLSWLKTGNMVNREMAYYKIPMELDIFDQEAFTKSGVPFYVTVTNLETGQAEYPKIDHVFDQMEYLRASSALPLVSKIVEIDGKKYLDGGLTDSIPVDFAKSLGFDKLIVILTQPFEYRKKPSSGRLYRLFYKDYPKFVEVASKRYQHYNEAVEKIIRMEEAGEVYVIRPDQALEVGRLERDPDKLEAVYEIGIRDGQATLPGLKEYLQASE